MTDVSDETAAVMYQTVRSTISSLDSILVTLLTQGNTFVAAILSIPLVANLHGFPAAALCLFSLVLSLFFLLGNILYWSLLKRSVQIGEQIEQAELASIGKRFHPTARLDEIPLSAARGSFFLYLVLPTILVLSSIALGGVYLSQLSAVWCGAFVLFSVLIVVSAVAVYGIYLRRASAVFSKEL